MSTRISSSGLMLVGIMAGALIFSQWPSATGPVVYGNSDPETLSVPGQDRPINSLRDLNAAYIDIAKAVKPTVVTIQIEKVHRVRRPFAGNPFFNSPFDMFFRDFPGQAPQQHRQPEIQEYRQRGLGSGVIVSEEGYILTNNHVIAQADTIYVSLYDNRTVPATIIGTDPKTDIAVLRVEEEGLPYIKLGDSDHLQVGEIVMAVGSPMSENLAHTVTSGIVSATGRSNMGIADYEDFIQTDAAINPGNSGGALINLDGKLVGINTAIASQSGGFQGIGFAVPINMARSVMESLIEHGKVVRGYLGVYIQDVNTTMAEAMGLPVKEGALISDVAENGPASKAGLEPGDVVLSVNGEAVSSADQLRNEIASTAPGKRVQLRVLRDGEEKRIDVMLERLEPETTVAELPQKTEDLFGFRVAELNRSLAEQYRLDPGRRGVVITAVTRNSPAFQTQLREGDLIVAINRNAVQSTDAFLEAIQDLERGDTVLLQVIRQNRSFFVAMQL